MAASSTLAPDPDAIANRTASRRVSFARIREPLAVPNLLGLQTESFDWLLGNDAWRTRVAAADSAGTGGVPDVSGLEEIFEEISPIEDFGQSMSLSFRDHRFEPPKYTAEECKERDFTYAAPMFVTAEFVNYTTGEIKSQTVFMGDFPLMTDRGTFIINGTERVVVSQLVRSPGVYFERTPDKTSDKDVFSTKFIPSRGAWLEFEIDKRDAVGVRVDRKRKQSVTVFLRALGLSEAEIREEFKDYPILIETLEKDTVATQDEALLDLYRKIRPGEPPTVEAGRNLLDNYYFQSKRYDLAKVGRYKVNKKLGLTTALSESVLRVDDIVAAIRYMLALHAGVETLPGTRNGEPFDVRVETDDIDHFGNRRIRAVGELIQNQVRTGLSRMERVVRERMTTQDVEAITPQTLINIRPVVASIKEFFGTSQLSQFMDQNNPLAGLTHKRRLSALGPGGLSRDRAGMEVRDVHPSHYGRMCPIETPEGPNIGLIGSLATYARINPFGFVETPYRKVVDGRVTDEVVFLTADDEDRHTIAQASAPLEDDGTFVEPTALCRLSGGEPALLDVADIDYMDVSARQMVSVATAMIPFLEHDDANRALMGANMQRQAVPLLRSEAPVVGTGMERRAAVDAGDVILATKDGVVTEVSADAVYVTADDGQSQVYRVAKFRRSNQGNCYNQRVLVAEGDRVVVGSVLADGPSTDEGELALGKNLLVAFMPWEGYNYEDAIILSQRLVSDDVLTSIHIEEHEVDARETKLGAEEITRDIPNVSEEVLADLDERGIIRIGAEVASGDILVGKVTPKGETELTSEERLLRAIFGEKAREVRDTSLRVPHGAYGIIVDVKVFTPENSDELQPGVREVVRCYIAQKRKISVGDKMAGRHGNKGVVSRILPQEDMPYLPDGTPLDIVLNPLGVPSRMNIGQVLEVNLGYAAKACGIKVMTPVFDSARENDIGDTFDTAREMWHGENAPAYPTKLPKIMGEKGHIIDFSKIELDRDGKTTVYDGRTGEKFDNRVTVGYMYYLKLHHLVDDKIHARSTGPYSLVTQQPLGGKAQFGGQRFGEMEVWALEAYGAAYTLQEILTVKSDDVEGRVKTYEAIVKGEPIPQPGIPESFRVMLKELQSLGMDVIVQDKDGNEIDMRQNFDDEETGFDMRDVAGTETVVQESELTDYNIKDADAGFDDPSVLEDDNSVSAESASSDEVDFDE